MMPMVVIALILAVTLVLSSRVVAADIYDLNTPEIPETNTGN